MTRQQTLRATGFCALILVAGLVALPALGRDADPVPLSTPAGITLEDVMQWINISAPQFLWRRLGDADGNPLYTYDQDAPGKANCSGDCAKEFPPLPAPAKAHAFGDWTLVKREGGAKQWAYQGKPLYRYSGKDPVGEPVVGGGNSGSTDDLANTDPGSKVFSPKTGWKRAAYTPEKTFPVPSGIEIRSLMTANGYGFVSPETGTPLYLLEKPPQNADLWSPVYAPALADKIGDFSLEKRPDGKLQWVYKGVRLYTFKGDYSANDINGTLEESGARVALAYRHFMPDTMQIRVFSLRGPLLTTADGLTVYTETRFHHQPGGRQLRDGYRYTYLDAKAVGVAGCAEECTQTWHPVAAPGDAQSAGFWEVAQRPDGTRQWLYRGSLLYTYAGDKAPGDINGNNRNIVLYGDSHGGALYSDNLTRVDMDAATKGARNTEGATLYWHTAGLFN